MALGFQFWVCTCQGYTFILGSYWSQMWCSPMTYPWPTHDFLILRLLMPGGDVDGHGWSRVGHGWVVCLHVPCLLGALVPKPLFVSWFLAEWFVFGMRSRIFFTLKLCGLMAAVPGSMAYPPPDGDTLGAGYPSTWCLVFPGLTGIHWKPHHAHPPWDCGCILSISTSWLDGTIDWQSWRFFTMILAKCFIFDSSL